MCTYKWRNLIYTNKEFAQSTLNFQDVKINRIGIISPEKDKLIVQV